MPPTAISPTSTSPEITATFALLGGIAPVASVGTVGPPRRTLLVRVDQHQLVRLVEIDRHHPEVGLDVVEQLVEPAVFRPCDLAVSQGHHRPGRLVQDADPVVVGGAGGAASLRSDSRLPPPGVHPQPVERLRRVSSGSWSISR